MRRSRVEAAETKERILAAASELFLTKGLAAVGTRDVMGAAGLTQGGFYRHFGSKDELIAEANAASGGRLLARVRGEVAGMAKADALERIVSIYLGQARDEGTEHRCTLAMIGVELGYCGKGVRDVAMVGYEHVVRLIAEHLPESVGEDVARGIVSLLVGAVTLARIALGKEEAKKILESAKATVMLLARGDAGQPMLEGVR